MSNPEDKVLEKIAQVLEQSGWKVQTLDWPTSAPRERYPWQFLFRQLIAFSAVPSHVLSERGIRPGGYSFYPSQLKIFSADHFKSYSRSTVPPYKSLIS